MLALAPTVTQRVCSLHGRREHVVLPCRSRRGALGEGCKSEGSPAARKRGRATARWSKRRNGEREISPRREIDLLFSLLSDSRSSSTKRRFSLSLVLSARERTRGRERWGPWRRSENNKRNKEKLCAPKRKRCEKKSMPLPSAGRNSKLDDRGEEARSTKKKRRASSKTDLPPSRHLEPSPSPSLPAAGHLVSRESRERSQEALRGLQEVGLAETMKDSRRRS